MILNGWTTLATNTKRALKLFQQAPKLIISPALDKWLIETQGDLELDDELLAIMSEAMRGARPHVEPGMSPSALGGCIRAQVMKYAGAKREKEYDSVTLNLLNDGKYRHLRWQAMLLKAGLLDEIETFVTNGTLRGFIDGIKHNEYIFELKGISSLARVRTGPLSKHKRQIYAYMILTGINTCVLIYEDKQTQEWKEFVITIDDISDKDKISIEEEMSDFEAFTDTQTLPERLKKCEEKDGFDYKYCSYKGICFACEKWEDISV